MNCQSRRVMPVKTSAEVLRREMLVWNECINWHILVEGAEVGLKSDPEDNFEDGWEGQEKGALKWHGIGPYLVFMRRNSLLFIEWMNQRMAWLVCGVAMRCISRVGLRLWSSLNATLVNHKEQLRIFELGGKWGWGRCVTMKIVV